MKNSIITNSALMKALFAGLLALLAWNYIADLTSGLSFYYSEGPVLDQAMRLARGKNIYPHDISYAPYTINNYGPLYYLLQAPLLRLSGPTLLWGQAISVLSHLASAWLAGMIIKRLAGSNQARAVTSLLVLASPLAGGGMPLYRVDPLAQAFSLAGVYIGVAAHNRRMLVLAAFLFTAAVFTKLTYGLAGPGALFFFCVLQGRRAQALSLAATTLVLCAAALGLAQYLTEGGFVFNIITANLMQFSLLRALEFFKIAYIQSAVATLAIPLLWQDKRLPSPAKLFVCLYLFFACVAAMAAGKVGANYGYFGEFQIALAFLLGLVISSQRKNWWYGALQLTAYSYFLLASPYHHFVRANRDDMAKLLEILRGEPGIVLADDYMGLLALSGKPLYFEPFEMTQLWRSGVWSQDNFVQELREGKFDMIVMGEVPLRAERWSPQMMEAIKAHYRIMHSSQQADIWRRK